MRRIAIIIAAMLPLAGCSIGQDVPIANKAIDAFHASIKTGQFDAIYDGTSSDLKRVSTKAQFGALLSAIHRKLGNFQSGSSAGWYDNVNTSGHFVTISYAAIYDRDKAGENFVFRIDDGKALLVGYHVNSNALVLN